jgi:hypothetical protein
MKMPFLDMDTDILPLKLGTKIYRCMIAINQPLTGRKIRGIEGYGHMILKSGLRQQKMRNGYVKKISRELSVCFDAVHQILL